MLRFEIYKSFVARKKPCETLIFNSNLNALTDTHSEHLFQPIVHFNHLFLVVKMLDFANCYLEVEWTMIALAKLPKLWHFLYSITSCSTIFVKIDWPATSNSRSSSSSNISICFTFFVRFACDFLPPFDWMFFSKENEFCYFFFYQNCSWFLFFLTK